MNPRKISRFAVPVILSSRGSLRRKPSKNAQRSAKNPDSDGWEASNAPSAPPFSIKSMKEQRDRRCALLRARRDQALEWLKDHGWVLCSESQVCEYAQFTRDGMKFNPAEASDRESLMWEKFTYSSNALSALERGDSEDALGWAFMAGFAEGKWRVLFVEAKSKSTAKAGKTKAGVDDIIRAELENNPKAKTADIMELFPDDVRAECSAKTLANRISKLRKEFIPHH